MNGFKTQETIPYSERSEAGSNPSFLKEVLAQYAVELKAELQQILRYWAENTTDETNGGFIGRITHDNKKHPDAPKGSVLNSRILWTFSAAYLHTKEVRCLQLAQRACAWLRKYFVDKDFGGVYWTVTAEGEPLDTKKRIYALAFAVYGLSEYYKASEEEEVKTTAIQLYQTMVERSHDKIYGGYTEAFSRDWQTVSDNRLSAKDDNERKSMNTHLHVLEAFANLYRIWPDEDLKQKLEELIRLFLDHIISPQTHHLLLFFEDDWTPKSSAVSFGHDIEAAWLLQEAAEIIGNDLLLSDVKTASLTLAQAAAQGLDEDGGLWYEYEPIQNHFLQQKHWWPQAEAMVGFFNAWKNTGDEGWLNHSLKSWAFVRNVIKDETGEWKWGVRKDGSAMSDEDKVGLWKCPYHNGRACIEIGKRIAAVPKN